MKHSFPPSFKVFPHARRRRASFKKHLSVWKTETTSHAGFYVEFFERELEREHTGVELRVQRSTA